MITRSKSRSSCLMYSMDDSVVNVIDRWTHGVDASKLTRSERRKILLDHGCIESSGLQECSQLVSGRRREKLRLCMVEVYRPSTR